MWDEGKGVLRVLFASRLPPRNWIARYCVVCRDLCAHTLTTTRRKKVYTPVAQCDQCATRYTVTRDSFLNVCAPRPDSLRALIERTNPLLPAYCLKRVAFDRALAAQELPAADRAAGLRAPFELLTYLAPPTHPFRVSTFAQVRSLALSIVAGFVVVGALVFLTQATLSTIWPKSTKSFDAIFEIAWLIGSPVGGALLYHWERTRNYRNVIAELVLPKLARSLRPARPTEEELSDIKAWLNASRNPLWKHVDFWRLAAQIRTLPDTSLRHVDDLRLEAWGQQIVQEYQERARQQAEQASQRSQEQPPE